MSRKTLSRLLKSFIALCSLTGVTVAAFLSQRDGYSHWTKRLLSFTPQSNIWIGLTALAFVLLPLMVKAKGKNQPPETLMRFMHTLRFIFTVSITVTGIIYCGLLAPFTDDSFPTWTFTSILVHVVVPILSIADFFVDNSRVTFKSRHAVLSVVPPLCYFVFTSILCLLRIDFGRGDPYPYFFMDYYSPAGLFGYVSAEQTGGLPILGSFYWIFLLLLLVYALSFGFLGMHRRIAKFNTAEG